MPKLSQADKAQVSQAIKHARLVDASRKLARIVKHVDPEPKVKAARARLEKSMTKWIKHHGGEAFDQPFSPDHKKVIAKIEKAINKGGLFALAMPRGHGKTTILKWAALYVMLTGRRKYVVIIAATAEMAQAFIEFMRQQIQESDSLHKHYPHVATYARATDGKAIKAKFQLRADGKTSGIQWSKTTLVMPEVLNSKRKPYISNGAIVEGHGLTGAIRGKWKDTKTGKTLRPDFVILDDPQTRESAESQTQCAMRERIITGDVLGLAGPRKKIAAVMPCTITIPGDLAARFLDHNEHPEWQGETTQLVKTWPDEQDGLWVEYGQLYRDAVSEGRGIAEPTAFYKANRAAMDEGAEVSWKERVRDGEISALQTAENLLIETGDQFWAEYQNDPKAIIAAQYDITPQLVCLHTTKLARLKLPKDTTVFVGHCDINRTNGGLHYCLAGFDQAMTGHTPAYGHFPDRGDLWPKNASKQVMQQKIYAGLKEVCDRIKATAFSYEKGGEKIQLGTFLIDAGFESDTVHRFCNWANQSGGYPFRVIAAIGRAGHKYRIRATSLIGKPYEHCHIQHSLTDKHKRYVMFNTDYWREVAQRAFLAEPQAAGGFTLHNAATVRYHMPFADQIVAEKLTNKYQTPNGMRWEFNHAPGSQWDWGDALTGCWVAAAVMGLSASGEPVVRTNGRKKYTQSDLRR